MSDNLLTRLRERAMRQASEGYNLTAEVLREAADEVERLAQWRHDTETTMLAASLNAVEERKRAEKAEAEVERLRADLAALKVTNCTGLLGIRISE